MIDWIASAFSIAGAFYVARHRNRGQLLWVIGNPLWITYFIGLNAVAPTLLFVYYEFTAIMGYLNWKAHGVEL